jgi:curli production assembly/transport component CsgF
MKSKKWFLILISLFLFPTLCYSSELMFEFTNPSFGGNPLYGTFLLEQAKMQNKFKEDYKFESPSLLEEFENVLQSQIIYNLASRIVAQAFGDTQQGSQIQPGTYLMGKFQITISYVSNGVQLTVTDLSTGQTTQLIVPQFTGP